MRPGTGDTPGSGRPFPCCAGGVDAGRGGVAVLDAGGGGRGAPRAARFSLGLDRRRVVWRSLGPSSECQSDGSFSFAFLHKLIEQFRYLEKGSVSPCNCCIILLCLAGYLDYL